MPEEHNYLDRISVNPNVCHGQATIRNLRYPVGNILELLHAGMTTEEILNDYPDLQKDDILAALTFEATLTKIKSTQRLTQ